MFSISWGYLDAISALGPLGGFGAEGRGGLLERREGLPGVAPIGVNSSRA